MSAPRLQYVTRGGLVVSPAPCALATTTAAGYAVAVALPRASGAGLLHLDSHFGNMRSDLVEESAAAAQRIDELTRRLRDIGPLEGASAKIAGGADVLGLMPQRMREELVRRFEALLSGLLRERGVAVDATAVGGRVSRRVEVRLPGGGIDVSVPPRVAVAALPEEARAGAARSVAGERPEQITVNIGCMAVARAPTRLFTLLGSCVGVAIYDPATKLGGLAHVMLPQNRSSTPDPSRYADTAVPALIDALLRAGAGRERLVAKLAGGASVMFRKEPSPFHRISSENISIVRSALLDAGIRVLEQEVGGIAGRRMLVDLDTFEMRVQKLGVAAEGLK